MCRLTLLFVLLLLLCQMAPALAAWRPENGPLMTRWAKEVSPENDHPEYPRPQMVRADWASLNGLWDITLAEAKEAQPILVPFPIESALSGVMKRAERPRYRRTFTVPDAWAGRRVLLNFEAVDWEATVTVNGKLLGTHRGGYDPFSFDITDALNPSGAQEVRVDVYDPTDKGDQPRGKQVNAPQGIFYTPTTGIWGSVWLEPVPESHIRDLSLTPDVEASALGVLVDAADAPGLTVRVAAYDGSRKVGETSGAAGQEIALPVPRAKLWSPADPHLYRLKVWLQRNGKTVDAVDSYFGMRSVSIASDGRVRRMMLNGEPVFQVGVLDQGFWPDGLYTAPTDAALKYDIQAVQGLGMNMIRKHVKVEPRRWYYWTDKLGMLVWQDMPSGDNKTPEGRAQFETELHRMVANLKNHPSIILWVPFNEGWGQYDTERVTRAVKEQDPSRLVDNASGWTDMKVGDVIDVHTYPMPSAQPPEEHRASVIGEFGGFGLAIPGHMWSQEHWGYRGLADSNELADRYDAAFRKVWKQKETPGISAVVYTQTTDVETEANGLLTYDRAQYKAPKARLRAANLGKLPPAPEPVPVVAAADIEKAPWLYTTEKPAEGWMEPGFDASGWKEGLSGFGKEGTPGAVIGTPWQTGDIWLRRVITLPTDDRKDYFLWLHHDENAEVYLNGVLAAEAPGYTTDYEEVPIRDEARAALHPGENTLAIHCRQTEGGQYIDAGLVKMVMP